jgi:hypothetical protein
MREVFVPTDQLLLSNHVEEGPVALYAEFVGRNIAGIHRVLVADVSSLLALDEFQRIRTEDCGTEKEWHVVIEGNHRSVAYALLRDRVPCAVLETDRDIALVKELSEKGHMCRFVHKETSLDELIHQALRESRRISSNPRVAVKYALSWVRKRGIDIANFPEYLRNQVIAK